LWCDFSTIQKINDDNKRCFVSFFMKQEAGIDIETTKIRKKAKGMR
jgi:hypothetical protein